jgi:hypothetical protein
MLLVYTALCFAMQLIFWLVPNIISSAVVFSIMGFFLGPFFAAVGLPGSFDTNTANQTDLGCLGCFEASSETYSTCRSRYVKQT